MGDYFEIRFINETSKHVTTVSMRLLTYVTAYVFMIRDVPYEGSKHKFFKEK